MLTRFEHLPEVRQVEPAVPIAVQAADPAHQSRLQAPIRFATAIAVKNTARSLLACALHKAPHLPQREAQTRGNTLRSRQPGQVRLQRCLPAMLLEAQTNPPVIVEDHLGLLSRPGG